MLDLYSVDVHNNQQVAALPQLDRGSDYESERHRFESYTPHQLRLKGALRSALFLLAHTFGGLNRPDTKTSHCFVFHVLTMKDDKPSWEASVPACLGGREARRLPWQNKHRRHRFTSFLSWHSVSICLRFLGRKRVRRTGLCGAPFPCRRTDRVMS